VKELRSDGRAASLLVAATTVLSVFVAFLLYPMLGQAAAALTIMPVALAGALRGVQAGVIVGVAIALADAITMLPSGTMRPTIEGASQVILGSVGFAVIGAIAGRQRDFGERVRSQAAALARELEQRRAYTDVLAHELRNPLVAIRAAARTREHGERQLELIAQEAGRALELLDSLNDASSIEAGRMRSVLGPTDLVATVQTFADTAGDLAGRLRLRLPEAPVVVNGDRERLGQVIRNLISNAAKYAPGSSPIEVNVGVSADRRFGVVQVRDYGPGIPPAERPQLFERFARLSTAGGTAGSGLGLYISRGIVRDHAGDLEAEWPSGGGSLFAFEIPLATGAAGR